MAEQKAVGMLCSNVLNKGTKTSFSFKIRGLLTFTIFFSSHSCEDGGLFLGLLNLKCSRSFVPRSRLLPCIGKKKKEEKKKCKIASANNETADQPAPAQSGLK